MIGCMNNGLKPVEKFVIVSWKYTERVFYLYHRMVAAHLDEKSRG